MTRVLYDLDVLRTFCTGVELGSFARAADKLGRSTSAVSAQLKKLESQCGTPLLRKSGRGLVLTEAGETLRGYALRLLELNDRAVAAVRGSELRGLVRLGLQEDLGESVLPHVLGQFARAHPHVRIEASVARSDELRERIALGQFDLALLWDAGVNHACVHGEHIMRLPLQWIGPASMDAADAGWARWRSGAAQDDDVLPLAMPGVMTGAILSLAHALGETAPLLMIGMVSFVPGVPEGFTGAATVLPVQVFIWENASERAFHERTAAAIIVLLVFMIVMNAAAVILRRRFERRW